MRALEDTTVSRSVGSPANGRLENGKRLPTAGRNFAAYSRLGALLGRNSVHGAVRDTVLAAYEEMQKTVSDQFFVYGETGWPTGGRFRPHRTHQNGMSVDFMMPVRDAASEHVVVFPTSPLNKFVYGEEFDRSGNNGNLRIDFDAVARHLAALDRAATGRRLKIQRVILAPEFLPLLRQTPAGSRLEGRLPFMSTPAWIRHDEHYHVDFEEAG